MRIVIFTTCAPFEDEKLPSQRLALYSWTRLSYTSSVEIHVLGDDKGTKEACEEYGLVHHPNVPTAHSVLGWPMSVIMLDAGLCRIWEASGDADMFVLLNSDLVLIDDSLLVALELINSQFPVRSAGWGRRYNCDVWPDLLYGSLDEQVKGIKQAHYNGLTRMAGYSGFDIFYWSREVFEIQVKMCPPFIFHAWRTDHYFNYFQYAVTPNRHELTEAVPVIHLNHSRFIEGNEYWKKARERNSQYFATGAGKSTPCPKMLSRKELLAYAQSKGIKL